jgi:hypothetical protein
MKEKEENKSVFLSLNCINVNDKTETKDTGGVQLTYLSWPFAWGEVVKRYPDASYEVVKDENGRPYFADEDYGLMCMTNVTIEGKTLEMWLPVMDGANKAMKRIPYTYKVWNRQTKQWTEKTVAAATMFDINKTIMRCLVKNLAMFGLGLYIYAGEDLPEGESEEHTAQMDALGAACDEARNAQDTEALRAIYYKHEKKFGKDKTFLSVVNERKSILDAA